MASFEECPADVDLGAACIRKNPYVGKRMRTIFAESDTEARNVDFGKRMCTISSIGKICGAEVGVRALCRFEPRVHAEQIAKVRQAMKVEIIQGLEGSKWTSFIPR